MDSKITMKEITDKKLYFEVFISDISEVDCE